MLNIAPQTAPSAVVIFLLRLLSYLVLLQRQYTVHKFATARASVPVLRNVVQARNKVLIATRCHTQLTYRAHPTVILVAMPTVLRNVAHRKVKGTGRCHSKQ